MEENVSGCFFSEHSVLVTNMTVHMFHAHRYRSTRWTNNRR